MSFFRGVGFCVCREGPKLYVKTIKQLGLYTSKQFKNGSNLKKCLKKGMPPVPVLAENHTPKDKRVWEYHMRELMKTERILEGNLCNLFAVLMSLCDSDMKNNVGAEEELDALKLLAMIKKLVYTGSTH